MFQNKKKYQFETSENKVGFSTFDVSVFELTFVVIYFLLMRMNSFCVVYSGEKTLFVPSYTIL